MAIYEYRCSDCNKTFSIREPISEHGKRNGEERGRVECPKCHGRKTHQRFSSFYAKTSSKT